MTKTTKAATLTLALMMPGALLAQDGVKAFGDQGTASRYGVATAMNTPETEGAPEDVSALVSAISDDTMPEISWLAVSTVTEIEPVTLSSLDGDPADAGLDEALTDADDRLSSIRENISENPAVMAVLTEEGLDPQKVIAVFGAAKSTVELVVDDRM